MGVWNGGVVGPLLSRFGTSVSCGVRRVMSRLGLGVPHSDSGSGSGRLGQAWGCSLAGEDRGLMNEPFIHSHTAYAGTYQHFLPHG